MKKFRWILLSGLLVATTQIAQAQAPGAPGAPGSPDGFNSPAGVAGGAADAGAITNTTTTTTTSGLAPDGTAIDGGGFVAPDSAASDTMMEDSSSMPNTGGEPMIAVLAGLSIAGAAVAMRRKVTA